MLEFKEITNCFPRIAKVRMPSFIGDIDIYVYQSPFLNCQMFSIGGLNQLLYVDDEVISSFIKGCIKFTIKTQLCIDLMRDHSKIILSKLEPYIDEINSMEYINTNGTKMVIHVIKLKQ